MVLISTLMCDPLYFTSLSYQVIFNGIHPDSTKFARLNKIIQIKQNSPDLTKLFKDATNQPPDDRFIRGL